jgi:hypothetical protein
MIGETAFFALRTAMSRLGGGQEIARKMASKMLAKGRGLW